MSDMRESTQRPRPVRLLLVSLAVPLLVCAVTTAQAQDSREAEIARAKAEKAKALHPYVPSKAETYIGRAEDLMLTGGLHWHPFFDSAYAGGGFTLGADIAASSARTTRWTCAAASPSRATSGLKPSSSRRACSIAVVCCR